MEKIDRTDHSPAARTRPPRSRTVAIVLHHLAVDADRDGDFTVDDAIAFFTRDPEGVATVTLAGSRASNAATVERWKREGVPAVMQGRGFVPYNFVVAGDGVVHRMLGLEAKGAHAGNVHRDWNDIAVGVACLGDFSRRAPTDAELDAVIALVGDILVMHPDCEILGHDDTLARDGLPPKGCPGRFFPIDKVREAHAVEVTGT